MLQHTHTHTLTHTKETRARAHAHTRTQAEATEHEAILAQSGEHNGAGERPPCPQGFVLGVTGRCAAPRGIDRGKAVPPPDVARRPRQGTWVQGGSGGGAGQGSGVRGQEVSGSFARRCSSSGFFFRAGLVWGGVGRATKP